MNINALNIEVLKLILETEDEALIEKVKNFIKTYKSESSS